MSGIWFRRGIQFVSSVNEVVGFKAGLALTREKMIELASEEDRNYLVVKDDVSVRIRPEEYESVIANILYAIGTCDLPYTPLAGMRMCYKYKSDPVLNSIYLDIEGQWHSFLIEDMSDFKERGTKPLGLKSFAEEARRKHGLVGMGMAIDLIRELDATRVQSPWSIARRCEWKDTQALSDLFDSEDLLTFYGQFFDQRFIDYLAKNFGEIDKINWRKFEGLTAEFFHRIGFSVELGPGRNDNGVDIRIWPEEGRSGLPPTALIQCKRTKGKIDKAVVKALWADVHHEKAEAGVIVTTSVLSPGAAKTCAARDYPINEANRETVKSWIEAMRTPGSGIFLGE